MIEFGRTLRAAREAKGYSTAQIAETTHLAPSMVEELEREDFSHIAAPIYGRGFVKLYCEAVGIDPKPLVNEFMEIYNGNREATIRERPLDAFTAAAPKPEAAIEEPPKQEEPPFELESDPLPEPPQAPEPMTEPEPEAEPELAPAPEPEPEPPAPEEDDLFSTAAQQPSSAGLSRYAAPVSQTRAYAASLPSTAVWRIAALACASIAILALLVFGARALYRATKATPEDVEEPASAPKTAEAPKANDAKPATQAAPRTQQAIPALYID